MKTRTFIIMVCLSACFRLPAQNSVCDKIFTTYEGVEGFSTLNFSGNLFTKLFSDPKKGDDWDISSVRMLFVNDSVINKKLNLYKEIVPNLKRKDYEELMNVKSSKNDFIILYKEKNHKITEIICVSGGNNNNALIYLKGNISVSNLQNVSEAIKNSEESCGNKKECHN